VVIPELEQIARIELSFGRVADIFLSNGGYLLIPADKGFSQILKCCAYYTFALTFQESRSYMEKLLLKFGRNPNFTKIISGVCYYSFTFSKKVLIFSHTKKNPYHSYRLQGIKYLKNQKKIIVSILNYITV